jgi:WD40 repeat protein
MDVPLEQNIPATLYIVPPGSAAPPKPLGLAILSSIKWSPDGKWLAYQCPTVQSRSAHPLCVASVSEPPKSRVLSALNVGAYAWSPVGIRLAFTAGAHSITNLFVTSPNAAASVTFEKSSIDWSPDGRQILFTDREHGKTAVYKVNADGSSRRLLTEPKLQAQTPLWSPDGKYIAFSAMDHHRPTVHIVNADGSAIRVIKQEKKKFELCTPASWLGNSTLLFFLCGNTHTTFSFWGIPALPSFTLFVADATESDPVPRVVSNHIFGKVSVAALPPASTIRSLDSLSAN